MKVFPHFQTLLIFWSNVMYPEDHQRSISHVWCLFNYNCRRNPYPCVLRYDGKSANRIAAINAHCNWEQLEENWTESWMLLSMKGLYRWPEHFVRLFYAQLLLNISQNADIYIYAFPKWRWLYKIAGIAMCVVSCLLCVLHTRVS